MTLVIRASQVLVGDALEAGVDVLLHGARIVAVGPGLAGDEVLELPGATLAPGFVELHVHVLEGVGVIGADGPDLDGLGRALLRRGVTSFLATSVTQPHADLLALVMAAGMTREGARCLGVHLEGPWISRERMGAQPAEHVRNPSVAELEELLAAGPVRLLTIAPELEGAGAVIARARAAGVLVAMGHTDATYDQACAAVDAGVGHVTHCFNAMRGLHHREPGTAGAALDLPGLSVEAIADGVHLHPAVLRLIWRARGRSSMCLVSDAVDLSSPADAMGGSTTGVSPRRAGAEPPHGIGADAMRLADGTLAGSVSALDHAVRTCVAAGIPLADALIMASRTPADAIGRPDLGRIEPGALADLVALDAELRLVAVVLDGTVRTHLPGDPRGGSPGRWVLGP